MFRPTFQITATISKALMRIEASRQAISDLPIDIGVWQRLRETALLATTHFSTQIEGNRLTLPEVQAAILGERFPGHERDEFEVRNHFRAHETMERMADSAGDITEADIKQLHGLVMTGRKKASPYREVQNVIRDAESKRIVYLPPEAADVPSLMRDLVAWIRIELARDELPAPIVAALAHYQFATVHPYIDGNGRTARLLATLILRKAGYGLKGIYSLDEHYAKNLQGYYAALSVGTHNYYDGRAEADVTQFVSYFCAGMADAFTKIKAAATLQTPTASDAKLIAIRDLDPRQRQLIGLFRKRGSATAANMARHLKMSPRTLVQLCREWIASGFLKYQNAARKNRSYRLGDAFEKFVDGE